MPIERNPNLDKYASHLPDWDESDSDSDSFCNLSLTPPAARSLTYTFSVVLGKSYAQNISRLLTPNTNEPLPSRLPFNTQVLKLYGTELLHLKAGNDLASADPSIEDIELFIHGELEVCATLNRMLIQIDDRIQIIKGPFTRTYATVNCRTYQD